MSTSYAQAAHDRRNGAISGMRAILDTAKAANRDLTPSEQERIAALDADAERYGKEADRAIRADELAKQAAEMRGDPTPRTEGPAKVSAAYDRTDYSSGPNAFRELVARFKEHGFATADFAIPENINVRALQSAGGSAVPTTFVERLTVYERTATPMLDPGIVTLSTVPTGEQRTFPRLTADVNHGGTVTAEAAAINELDPTIGSAAVKPFKYAVITNWSGELDTDNVINLERVVATSTGRELALDIGTHLTTGTGTTQPFGFIGEASNGGTAAGTALGAASWTFYGPPDLSKLYTSLASPYRAAGTWQVSTAMLEKILSWRDSNQDMLIEPMSTSPSGLGLYGRPLVENPAMAAPASATKSIAFGDFSAYEVVRLPVRVEMSRDYKWSTDQVSLRVIERVDGRLIDAAAVAFLVAANT